MYQTTTFGKQQRAFNKLWLTRYIYSPSLNGVFCLPCAIFRSEVKLKGNFENEPCLNWKKSTEKFNTHFVNIRHSSDVVSSPKKSGTGYELHLLGVALEENFLKVMENKQSSINMQLAAALGDP